MELKDVWQVLKDGGLQGLLFILILAGSRKLWVWGWMYKELQQERDEWKALALKGTHLAERGAHEVEKAELIRQILDIQSQLISRQPPEK